MKIEIDVRKIENLLREMQYGKLTQKELKVLEDIKNGRWTDEEKRRIVENGLKKLIPIIEKERKRFYKEDENGKEREES
jgi:hypothetical protein